MNRGFSFREQRLREKCPNPYLDTLQTMIALKAIHVIPALLLQKLNKNSKTKDHVVALERRLDIWEN